MKLPLPINLLLNYETHGELWVFLRLRAVRALWLNWTYKDLSKALHISHTCLRKYLPRLIKLGWVRIECNTLICTSLKKLRVAKSPNGKEYKAPCKMIKLPKTKTDAIIQFRSVIITTDLQKQAYIESRKKATDKKLQTAHGKLTKAEVRRITLAGGAERFSGSIQEINLSNNTFGKLIGRSLSTGKALQRQLNKLGVICSKTRLKEVASNVSRLEWLYNYMPYGKGLIYCENSKSVKQRLSNAITLC